MIERVTIQVNQSIATIACKLLFRQRHDREFAGMACHNLLWNSRVQKMPH